MSCSPSPSSSAPARTPQPVGAVCLFSCGESHELQGAFSMECGSSGKWSSDPPTCTGIVSKFAQMLRENESRGASEKSDYTYVVITLSCPPPAPQHWFAPCSKPLKMAKSTAPTVNRPTTQSASSHAITTMCYMDMTCWSAIATATGRERSPFAKVK